MAQKLATELVEILAEFIVALGLLVALELLGKGEQLFEESVDVIGVVRQLHLLVGALLDGL